jgi:SAM-dependent methyltransferase
MDINPNLLAGARERSRRRSLDNVEFQAADLTGELPRTGFEAVLALECLSEIPDDRAALRTMAAAVSPGGIFVVQVPDRHWTPILPGSPSTWREEVRHGYDAEELTGLLREAGLEQIEIRPTFRSITMVAQEVRDRIKSTPVLLRALAFPFLVAAVQLERWGLHLGRPNALLATGRRPG